MAHDIFVSYSRPDLERVRPIVRLLEKTGWSVWWDQRLLAGKKFTDEIRRELEATRVVVVVWSANSFGSDWVQSEAQEGMDREILVPLRLDDVKLPYPFGRLHTIDLFSEGESNRAAVARLLASLEALLGKAPARRTSPPTAAAPAARRTVPPAERPRVAESEPVPAPPVSEPSQPAPTRAVPRRRAPASRARTTPSRRPAILLGSALAVALAFGWVYRTTRAGKDDARPQLVGEYRPGNVPFRVEPGSGCRVPYDWEVVDATPDVDGWARQVREPRTEIVFQLIRPGEFDMGSPEDEPGRADDETLHRVHITRPFYLGVTEVTYRQLNRLLGKPGGSDRPVDKATWTQAKDICHDIGCTLPTEAQWEFAARAGTRTRWWWGDTEAGGAGKANLFDVTAGEVLKFQPPFSFVDGRVGATEVGSFDANAFGLHDMVGNVWEWCLDDYVEDLGTEPVLDPRMEAPGEVHVARGGAALSRGSWTRSAARRPADDSVLVDPDIPEDYGQSGFRACLSLPGASDPGVARAPGTSPGGDDPATRNE